MGKNVKIREQYIWYTIEALKFSLGSENECDHKKITELLKLFSKTNNADNSTHGSYFSFSLSCESIICIIIAIKLRLNWYENEIRKMETLAESSINWDALGDLRNDKMLM